MEGRGTGSQGFGRGTESEQHGRGRGLPQHESSDAALSDDPTIWNQLSPLSDTVTTPYFPSPSLWDEITGRSQGDGSFPAGGDGTSTSHQIGAQTDSALHPLVTPSGQEHLDQSSVPSTSTTSFRPMISSDPPLQVVQQFQRSTNLPSEVQLQFGLNPSLEQNVPIPATEEVIAGQSYSHFLARGRLGARGGSGSARILTRLRRGRGGWGRSARILTRLRRGRGGWGRSARIPTRLGVRGRGHGSGSVQIPSIEQEAANRRRRSQMLAEIFLGVRRRGGRGGGRGRGRG